jgi:hypothetical protein
MSFHKKFLRLERKQLDKKRADSIACRGWFSSGTAISKAVLEAASLHSQ